MLPIMLLLAAPLLGRREHLELVLSNLLSSSTLLTTADRGPDGARPGHVALLPGAIDVTIDTTKPTTSWRVTLPLEACGGGASCVRFTATGKETTAVKQTLFPSMHRTALPFRVYRVIVDTGSPYLVVSGSVGDDVLSTGSFPVLDDESNDAGSLLGLWRSFLDSIGGNLGLVLPEGFLPDPYDELPFDFADSPYGPTEEIYGSQSGRIQWMSSPVGFRNPNLVSSENEGMVLGVMDDALTRESGGSLIGLVKRSNPSTQKIERRPTFLEQERIVAEEDDDDLGRKNNGPENGPETTPKGRVEQLDISSFVLDYPNKELTLSSDSLIPHNARDAISLVDLRPLGDFVEHYACRVEEVVFDNVRVTSKLLLQGRGGGAGAKRRDIVAVFDSGLTGCLLIRPFWDRLIAQGLDPSTFASVDVKIKVGSGAGSDNGKRVLSGGTKHTKEGTSSHSLFSIQSYASLNPLFYVAPISLDWFDDESTAPFVVVLGQTFLTQGALTVDMDDRRATFVRKGSTRI